MSEIVLLDTTVYLNVLNVPGWNQQRESIWQEFEKRINRGDTFLLPMASIWETGNHIARLPDGGRRRQFAQDFVNELSSAFSGDAPYSATHFPDKSELLEWISDFPEYAMRNKSENKLREGISLADMAIIKEYDRTCKLNPRRTVSIWSLDSDLKSYRRVP